MVGHQIEPFLCRVGASRSRFDHPPVADVDAVDAARIVSLDGPERFGAGLALPDAGFLPPLRDLGANGAEWSLFDRPVTRAAPLTHVDVVAELQPGGPTQELPPARDAFTDVAGPVTPEAALAGRAGDKATAMLGL